MRLLSAKNNYGTTVNQNEEAERHCIHVYLHRNYFHIGITHIKEQKRCEYTLCLCAFSVPRSTSNNGFRQPQLQLR